MVRTPHSSNFSKEGVGALGVSMNSNSDSLPLVLWGFDIVATKLSLSANRVLCEDRGREAGTRAGKAKKKKYCGQTAAWRMARTSAIATWRGPCQRTCTCTCG